jgi:NitT/TauT family transport system substrate-binding protein
MKYRLLALLCAALFAASAQAEELKVVTAQKGAWPTSMTEWGARQGFFKEQGLDVTVFYTAGGAPTVQAVLSGSADIGTDTGILGILGAFAKGAPVRIISPSSTGGADIYWYAKADSGIHSLKDATGKTIGFSERGSSSNLTLLALLAQAGVKANTVAAGGMPATLTQVMSGQIDVGWAAAPFALPDVNAGKLVIVAHGNDVPAVRNETVRVNIVTATTLQTKRDEVVRFMKGLAKTIAWANGSPVAVQYFAEANSLPLAIAQQGRSDFYPPEMLQLTEVKGLDTALQQAADNHFIPHPMTAEDVAPLIQVVKP